MKLYLQKHAGGWIWPTGPSLPSPVLNDATFCQFSGLPLCLVHTLFFSQVNWVATANIWVYLSTHIWFLQLWYYEKVRNSEHNRLVLLISWLFGKLLSFFEPLSCDCKWRFFFLILWRLRHIYWELNMMPSTQQAENKYPFPFAQSCSFPPLNKSADIS